MMYVIQYLTSNSSGSLEIKATTRDFTTRIQTLWTSTLI